MRDEKGRFIKGHKGIGNVFKKGHKVSENSIKKTIEANTGTKHHWKGGITYQNGYKFIRIGKKYKREHRIIAEENISRKLKNFEVVHHINGIKDDNRFGNLDVMTKREHDRLHHLGAGV